MRGASVPLENRRQVTGRVKDLARQEEPPLCRAARSLQVLLQRLSGSEDVVVGTPLFARSKPEFLRVVGNFVNSLALRSAIDRDMTFRDLVVQLRQTVIEGIEAQEFPLLQLVQRLQPKSRSGPVAAFDTFFLFQRFDQFNDVKSSADGKCCR